MTERGIKIRDAFRKKYGVDHPSQLKSVKEKIKQKRKLGAYKNVPTKLKETLLKKYGNSKYVNVEKTKQTKLLKYGSETYNNRKKWKQTLLDKFGMLVSPNTLKSTTFRAQNGIIGFKSEKYKKYLNDLEIFNISQIPEIKNQKNESTRLQMIEKIFNGDRLKGTSIPLFKPEEYINSCYHTLYQFKCCKCGETIHDTLYSGNIPRCLKCYPHHRFTSSIEIEISSFLKEHNQNIILHDRTILNGLEIDILLPDINVGIECNGIIWHSEGFGKKDKLYHITKTKLAKEKGIRLIQILDWEWINKKSIIKGILLNILNKSKKISFENCDIIFPTKLEARVFLDHNYLFDIPDFTSSIALKYQNRLISIMIFKKTDNYFELLGHCHESGLFIIDGTSKLLQSFIDKECPTTILANIDRRFFSGSSYINCNMRQFKESQPEYIIFHKNFGIPLERSNMEKCKFSNFSLWDDMKKDGFDRFWDCGNLSFVWT
jgi:hypothetical protein